MFGFVLPQDGKTPADVAREMGHTELAAEIAVRAEDEGHKHDSEEDEGRKIQASSDEQMLVLDNTQPAEQMCYLLDLGQAPPPSKLRRVLRYLTGAYGCFASPYAANSMAQLFESFGDVPEDVKADNDDADAVREWLKVNLKKHNQYSHVFKPSLPPPAIIITLGEGWRNDKSKMKRRRGN